MGTPIGFDIWLTIDQADQLVCEMNTRLGVSNSAGLLAAGTYLGRTIHIRCVFEDLSEAEITAALDPLREAA